ncbi:PGF-CTERM sorting domain-containing protein [Halorhabdus sp. BNX81]|uniref:PGF-CTERM sorting domain-containing protein n=1 Tax=Halorhabdus sp. BNX81 TaxID=2980181 RepID=UPI0023DD5D04|nr:PGF-CTERM sorting domain-containing protein [Halorhabdus sp. BNX81]
MEEDLEANYVLGSDIAANSTEKWNSGKGFDPIGSDLNEPFQGSFNGNGHIINELTIMRMSENHIGLFGVINGGSIRSVHLKNVDIQGDILTAGLVGHLRNGKINSSIVTGEIRGSRGTGGIVGDLYQSNLHGSSTYGRVTGDEDVGGVVGYVGTGGVVTSSVSHSNIESTDISAGGLIGMLGKSSKNVQRSYATGTVQGGEDIGGLVGRVNEFRSPKISSSYWDTEQSGIEEGIGAGPGSVTGLTTEQMTGSAAKEHMEYLFVGTDFMTTDSYPVLEQHVKDVDVSLTNSLVSVEDTTDITVRLDLYDGSTTTATTTADYNLDGNAVTIEDGTLTPAETGKTNISVTVNGKTDTATLDVRTPADISMTDAALDTSAILANSTAAVTATLENDGGMPGSEPISTTVEGETVHSDTVHVGGHDETTATFSWSVGQAGSYDITLGDHDVGELTVVDNDSVRLRDVIAPKTVTPGGTYAVKAIFENTADTAVSVPVTFRGDGQIVADRLRVQPGETTQTFDVNASKPTGRTITHAVSLGETTRRANTTILAPATFEVAGLDVPETVDTGETMTVTATVRNTGDIGGSTAVSLDVAGDERTVENTSLEAGETQEIDIDVTAGAAGTLEFGVTAGDDSLTEAVTVQSDAGSHTTTATGSAGGDSDSNSAATTAGPPDGDGTTTTNGPGFGVTVALVALLGGGLVVARQQ